MFGYSIQQEQMSVEVCCRRYGLFIFYLLKDLKRK